MVKVIEAGTDQFGGEMLPELLVDLVRSGEIDEARVDASARRLLREKFVLGLFEEPFVDPDAAEAIVGSAEFRAAGEAAQRRSVTILVNREDAAGAPTLPLAEGVRLYVEGIEPQQAAAYGSVVGDPAAADVAIIRLSAPFEVRGGGFEAFFHQGSLDFDEETVARVLAVSAVVPTVVEVFLDRPAILTPILGAPAAIVGTFGTSPTALLDVLFGRARPEGSLPFDLPSSMAAVEASRPDVPFDTAFPLFRFGHGLRY